MRVNGAVRNPNLSNIGDIEVKITVNINPSGQKSLIHNVFIVDASGSMSGGKYENAIVGVNELIKNIKTDLDSENTLTVVEFEQDRIETRVETTKNIPDYYRGMGTGGGTPLNKAVGETLEKIVAIRAEKYNKADKILVNVFTDGGENHSTGKYGGYNGKALLGKLIKDLESDNVVVTFIGTKEEVNYAINQLNLDLSNTLVHDNTASGVQMAYNTTVNARMAFSKSVAKGEDVKKEFYTKVMPK